MLFSSDGHIHHIEIIRHVLPCRGLRNLNVQMYRHVKFSALWSSMGPWDIFKSWLGCCTLCCSSCPMSWDCATVMSGGNKTSNSTLNLRPSSTSSASLYIHTDVRKSITTDHSAGIDKRRCRILPFISLPEAEDEKKENCVCLHAHL